MNIDRVTVSYGIRRSINFQSCGIDVALSAVVEADEDYEDVRVKLEEICKSAVKRSIAAYEAETKGEKRS